MDALIYLVILLLLIYPYWLIMRFLQLGCKAFKKYINEPERNPFVLSYGDEDHR